MYDNGTDYGGDDGFSSKLRVTVGGMELAVTGTNRDQISATDKLYALAYTAAKIFMINIPIDSTLLSLPKPILAIVDLI